MFSPTPFYSPAAIITEDEEKARKAKMSLIIERYKDRVSTLPKHKSWVTNHMCKYEGFWYPQGVWFHSNASYSVETVMALQDDFQAQPTDVFLASQPKSGTTWLKALAYAIMNRAKFKNNIRSNTTHPLLTISPHDCVPFIETDSFLSNPCYAEGLLATHIPYSSLPKSIISSSCRIVYICRNPKDVLISLWHFMNKLKDDLSPIKLEDAFEWFSKGVNISGSFWDHVIGYHKASLEQPDKVLFLKYEDMKKDPKNEAMKLANFLGYPFTKEELADGTVQEIIALCSFEKLSEVNKGNKDGDDTPRTPSYDIHFRKGKVGDSVNYLTPEMIQILDGITKEKFHGLDLSF